MPSGVFKRRTFTRLKQLEYLLRFFLTSYFWPNWRRKNPGNRASAIVKIDAVVSLGEGYDGLRREKSGHSDKTGNSGVSWKVAEFAVYSISY
jgi:hypothetical protein